MDLQDIVVRRPRFDFEQDIPHFFVGNNPLKTHFFNAINLAFPDGERFFIKAVNDHAQRLEDPRLLAQVRGFCGQEGEHARQHERFFKALERQGYDAPKLQARFRAITRWGNRYLPRALRLSITAGAEHYTATIAALILRHNMLVDCEPTMRSLIEWHALEEIEHKHVAYDVMRRKHPYNYPLRIAGFLIASLLAGTWTYRSMRELLTADGRARRLSRAGYRRALRELEGDKEQRFRRAVQGQLLRYFVPGFHPKQQDDQALVDRYRPDIAARLLGTS